MHQRPHPQLHAAEDTAQPPHVLILQIRAVAPAVHLHGQFVPTLPQITRHVELRGRHRVLAIAHSLAVDPYVEGRLHTAEVQDQVLPQHLLRHVHISDVRAYGIAMVVGIPVLRRLGGHARTVALKRVNDVRIDRLAVALRLPVAWHGDLIPLAHVVVLPLEAHGSAVGILRPSEIPLSVERHNLLTLSLP